MILIKFVRNYNKEEGISIIEIIVAVVIIGLCLPWVINIFITTTQANVESKEKQQALNLAQRIIEELRAVSPSQLREAGDQISNNNYSGIKLDNYSGVQKVDVIIEGDLEKPNLTRVLVRVQWGSKDNSDMVELGTLILDHESI